MLSTLNQAFLLRLSSIQTPVCPSTRNVLPGREPPRHAAISSFLARGLAPPGKAATGHPQSHQDYSASCQPTSIPVLSPCMVFIRVLVHIQFSDTAETQLQPSGGKAFAWIHASPTAWESGAGRACSLPWGRLYCWLLCLTNTNHWLQGPFLKLPASSNPC